MRNRYCCLVDFELFEFDPHSHESISCSIQESAAGYSLSFSVLDSDIWAFEMANSLGDFQEGLWTATCFEAFEFDKMSDAYVEWNFSAEGRWFFQRFQTYRTPNKLTELLSPLKFQVALEANTLHVFLELPKAFKKSQVQLNVVLKSRDSGDLCYFAKLHPGHKPDFHLRLLEEI